MLFKHFGGPDKPAIVLLHGGGLGWWIWQRQIAQLICDYHIIAPDIDGHDIDGNEFISITQSSDNLIAYIDKTHAGSVFALGGFSLGAQIALETLGKRPDIAEYAVIESALTEPLGCLTRLMPALAGLSYGLISKRWFARAQAAQMFIPEKYFETYFESSQMLSKASLLNVTRANAAFRLNPSLSHCSAKTLILAGTKEPKAIVQSAAHIGQILPNAKLTLLNGYRHGELCIKHPEEYVRRLKAWLE